VVDWEEFTSRVALHDALAAWLDEAVATTNTTTTNSSSSTTTTTTTTTTSITNFIETHQIDIGFNSWTQRARSRVFDVFFFFFFQFLFCYALGSALRCLHCYHA
jgi:hypothetical protein